MTPEAFTDALNRLGLSQAEAARFLGKRTDRMINRYKKGLTPVPYETEMLLRLMLGMKLTPAIVKAWMNE